MRVLILHQHFNSPYSGGAVRSYYLAKALVDAGHDVTVITGSNRPAVIDADIDGIQVYYLPVPYDNKFGFYKRSVSFFRFVKEATRFASRFSNADICYAISVPLTVGVAAMRIQKKYKIPFVFEVGDLWPDAPIEMGFVANPLMKKILLSLERQIYQRAELVVALSNPIADAVKAKCPGIEVAVVPNMADTHFYKPQNKSAELKSKFNVGDNFVISYIGSLGFANGLMGLIEIARVSLEKKLPVHFLMCGEGAMRKELQADIKRLRLTNVSLLPFTNREGVREVLDVTDAAFISFLPYPILTTGSPNKYFDALAAGKMVILNFSGWIKSEIESEQLGFSVGWNDGDAFVKKINVFLEDRAQVAACGQRSRQVAERQYSRSLLSARFVSILERFQSRKSFPGK